MPDSQTTLVTGRAGYIGSRTVRALRIAGQPVPHEVTARRPGDPDSTSADPTFATSVLGWAADDGLDEIIRTAYEWHRHQI